MKIMMFNGLLFLLFMWTSAEMGPETDDIEGFQDYENERHEDIQTRKRSCKNLSGKCIKNNKDCPSNLRLETKPGEPYCSNRRRCCYPDTSSCNLVWNYKEERPLIMIRESKTIVPPVIDRYISTDPNRIPIGRKLIFACPGENNQFNHVSGTHTKLLGECISEDKFKVCVNNNPEHLHLSQLSCSRKMFPSFIKDNDTTAKKSCDDIGGELYKTGYTYGDYHEFKDLEIQVCFHEKNQNTLCTSPNLYGNETDYRTTELSRKGHQRHFGNFCGRIDFAHRFHCLDSNGNVQRCTPHWPEVSVDYCGWHGGHVNGHQWCYYKNNGIGTFCGCGGDCNLHMDFWRNHGCFLNNYPCPDVLPNNFVHRRSPSDHATVTIYQLQDMVKGIDYKTNTLGNLEEACVILNPIKAWICQRTNIPGFYDRCSRTARDNYKGVAASTFNGHLLFRGIRYP